jgi:hypothetical protein
LVNLLTNPSSHDICGRVAWALSNLTQINGTSFYSPLFFPSLSLPLPLLLLSFLFSISISVSCFFTICRCFRNFFVGGFFESRFFYKRCSPLIHNISPCVSFRRMQLTFVQYEDFIRQEVGNLGTIPLLVNMIGDVNIELDTQENSLKAIINLALNCMCLY